MLFNINVTEECPVTMCNTLFSYIYLMSLILFIHIIVECITILSFTFLKFALRISRRMLKLELLIMLEKIKESLYNCVLPCYTSVIIY